jgi:uncharacterized membrane protein
MGQPPYQQPPMGQPPYGPPPGGPPPYQQQPPQYQQQAQQAVQKMIAPVATVDTADAYDRVASLIAYLWIVFFGFESLLGFRIVDFGVRTTDFSFAWDLRGLLGIIGPLAIMWASRGGRDLTRFHAKQALFLALAYIVARAVLQLFFLIPAQGFQNVVMSGLLIPLLQLTIAFVAIFAGIRAFLNKELYRIPVISGFVGR